MKKFLIFLVSIVVVVSIGLTTYYFLKNDEVISIATKEIYCNAGDVISLDSLGINVKKPHRKTTFDYNAGGESVTSFIEYDADKNYYVVGNQGGEVTLVIGTTNAKFAEFTIIVHIGDGSKEYPYNIMDENDLNLVRDNCSQPKYYKLMNDINLSSGFTTIGSTTAGNIDFMGYFDGNGHVISGLNIDNQDMSKVGLFASVAGEVSNLTIANANISGTFDNVGVLAGSVTGTVKNVAIKNSTIVNKKQGNTGSVAGYTNKALISSSFADSVTISVGDETNVIANVVAGGFVGKMAETTAQATYTNNIVINVVNQASGKIAGYAGEFVIGNNTGSVQQSYVNSSSNSADYTSFISEVSTVSGFDASKSNMLRHFVGNIVIVKSAVTTDTDLIKTFDNSYFANKANPTASVFFDNSTSQYMIRGYENIAEIQEYVFYAVNSSEKTLWDDTIWNIKTGILPTLKMAEVAPSGLSIDYLNKNLAQIEISDLSQILGSTTDGNVLLVNDIDLSAGWTPVAVENFVLDGNNKTITVNLNTIENNTIALFTTLTNSTVKDLTIKVVGFTNVRTSYGAALAGFATGSNGLNTVIDNVKVVYDTEIAPNVTDFGGIVTYLTDSQIKNSSVKLNISENANIYMRTGGAVADMENSTISNFNGKVEIDYNQINYRSYIGGIVGYSVDGTITKSEVETKITLVNIKEKSLVGGLVGYNNSEVSNSTASGEGIIFQSATGRINLGGIAGQNVNTIKNSNNFMNQVGTYKSGYNVYAGGIAAINAGAILECVASSDIHGNVVAGIAAEMTNRNATANKVLVGKFDTTNGQISKNTISGDRYVAGVVVNFQNGYIENVQTCSEITGMANATRSSLIVLIFPYNTTLVNATINNSFSASCQGTKYAETWSDFVTTSTNSVEFGLSETNLDGRFNLYKSDASHGKMQSVVLNTDNTSDAIKAMGEGMIWSSEYNNTDESSFIKYVDSSSYASTSTYIGSFSFVVAKGWFGRDITITKTLNFDLGDGNAWKADAQTGIVLTFLSDLVEAA